MTLIRPETVEVLIDAVSALASFEQTLAQFEQTLAQTATLTRMLANGIPVGDQPARILQHFDYMRTWTQRTAAGLAHTRKRLELRLAALGQRN